MKRLGLIAMTSILILNLNICHAGIDDYEVRQLTFDNTSHMSVSASSFGEVIWVQKVDGYWQVFSLDKGQLTFDEWDHISPDINFLGEIVYRREKDGETPGIYSNLRGKICEGSQMSSPRINDIGEIIWRECRYDGCIFRSNIKGKVTHIPAYSADINSDREVIYTGRIDRDNIGLFSTNSDQKISGFGGGKPRINNHGEKTWKREAVVGNKTYKQIYSNIKGPVIDFCKGDNIRTGDIDDDGIIYFTKKLGSRFQIFAAIPKKILPTYRRKLAGKSEGLTAEAYEPADKEEFAKLDKPKQPEEAKPIETSSLIITEPPDGSRVSGIVNISIFSNNREDISHCKLQVDGKDIDWDYSAPFGFAWNSKYCEDGQHTVKVTGHSKDNISPTETATSTVTSDNEELLRPYLSITSPSEGETISGTITIKTDATEDNFNYIYSYIDNEHKQWDDRPPYKFTLDTTVLSNGTHTIKVYGWHKQASQSMRSAVNVMVRN